MIRKYLCIFVVLCLLLVASGCQAAQSGPASEQTQPTLPDFQEELTPLQQLLAAREKTQSHGSYEVRYGTRTVQNGQTEEKSQMQNVTTQKNLNLDAMYEYLPELPQKQSFLEEFCSRSMEIVPSNTGRLRFQMSGLTWEETWPMMYHQAPDSQLEQAECEVAFEVDAYGRLSDFELIMTMEEETRMVFLSIAFTEDT